MAASRLLAMKRNPFALLAFGHNNGAATYKSLRIGAAIVGASYYRDGCILALWIRSCQSQSAQSAIVWPLLMTRWRDTTKWLTFRAKVMWLTYHRSGNICGSMHGVTKRPLLNNTSY
ncbi:unnamed protein product [Ceratitis capitata]|uniref:(Mediterranean fruit fly) hypothetical protein n=1 Tax=Ceratitis capitata TaxID=7213 RepID=A0A811UU63_CERCA|nr:unnamed protein product [Ceratitis capitata]